MTTVIPLADEHPRSSSKKYEFLLAAMTDRTLVRFSTRFEDGRVHGYVAAVGPKFFILALVSDRIRFDGFECFRIVDIRKPRADPWTAFVETALKARGEVMAECTVDATSLQNLLTSARAAFPVVTVHEELRHPHECQIGQVRSVARSSVSLLEIDPAAVWDVEPTIHRLSDITRVGFGGEYEQALCLVGGEPRQED